MGCGKENIHWPWHEIPGQKLFGIDIKGERSGKAPTRPGRGIDKAAFCASKQKRINTSSGGRVQRHLITFPDPQPDNRARRKPHLARFFERYAGISGRQPHPPETDSTELYELPLSGQGRRPYTCIPHRDL
jgi:hypothetical protein